MAMGKKFPSVKHSTVAEKIFKMLHGQILSGKLKPGERLPSQDKLARQLGVGRNTLREAIYKLMVMGLLTTRQGSGTVVNISSPSNYMSSLAEHLMFNPATIREFVEARLVVEQATVRLAVMRMTSDDLATLEALIDQQTEAFEMEDVDAFIKFDSEFHRQLARISGNAVLLKFLETVRDMLDDFVAGVSRLPGGIQSALKYHREIVQHMQMKEIQLAAETMRAHLYDVTKRIEKNMGIDLGTKSLFEINSRFFQTDGKDE
jgi:DNA-binding FadR family transcriptional regulator